MTISFQEIPLADWSLLLSQRQDFLNNHLALVPITPNQEGSMEMGEEVLSNVGAQDMDTSGYQVSDLDDVEFYWENDQLDVDTVFKPGIDIPFSPSTFNDFKMGSLTENPILIDEEEDKENCLPLPEQLQCLRDQTNPLCWWKVAHSEQELKMFPIMFIEICLNNLYFCYCVFILI